MQPPDHVLAMEPAARAKTGRRRMVGGSPFAIPATDANFVSWKAADEAGLWDCRFRAGPKTKILAVVRCGFRGGVRVLHLVEDRRGLEFTFAEEGRP
jgi:hypothetical protein